MQTPPGKGGGGGGGGIVPSPGRGRGEGMLTPPSTTAGGVGITVPETSGKGGAGGTAALLERVAAVTAAEREAISFLASSSSLDNLATCYRRTLSRNKMTPALRQAHPEAADSGYGHCLPCSDVTSPVS